MERSTITLVFVSLLFFSIGHGPANAHDVSGKYMQGWYGCNLHSSWGIWNPIIKGDAARAVEQHSDGPGSRHLHNTSCTYGSNYSVLCSTISNDLNCAFVINDEGVVVSNDCGISFDQSLIAYCADGSSPHPDIVIDRPDSDFEKNMPSAIRLETDHSFYLNDECTNSIWIRSFLAAGFEFEDGYALPLRKNEPKTYFRPELNQAIVFTFTASKQTPAVDSTRIGGNNVRTIKILEVRNFGGDYYDLPLPENVEEISLRCRAQSRTDDFFSADMWIAN